MTDLQAKNWSVAVRMCGAQQTPLLFLLWVLLRKKRLQECLWMVLLKVIAQMDWQPIAFLADYLHPYSSCLFQSQGQFIVFLPIHRESQHYDLAQECRLVETALPNPILNFFHACLELGSLSRSVF